MHLVAKCDLTCVASESHICRHAKHTMCGTSTLEYFHQRCFKSYSQFMHKNRKHTETVEKHDSIDKDLGGMICHVSSFNSQVTIDNEMKSCVLFLI